jgi:hypothetical protein
METIKTKQTSLEEFKRGFQKNMKLQVLFGIGVFIMIIWLMIISCELLIGLSQSVVLPSFGGAFISIFAMLSCLLFGMNKIEYFGLNSKSIIKWLEEDIQKCQKKLDYLKRLQSLDAEDFQRFYLIKNDEEMKEEYTTAAAQIAVHEENIRIAKQKVAYLMNVCSLWQYFRSLKWMKKIAM